MTQLLQKKLDRFLITKPEDRDLVKEAALLNDFVLKESQVFLRMLGSIRSVNNQEVDLQLKPEEDTEIEITDEPLPDKQSNKADN